MTAVSVLNPNDYKGVPLLYIETANVLIKADKERISLKNAFYGGDWEWHSNPKTIFVVAINVMNRKKQCDILIEKSGILKAVENAEINLIRTLITELLWGKNKRILGNNEVIKTVRKFRKQFLNAESSVTDVSEVSEQSVVRFCRVNTLKTTVEDVVEYLKRCGLTQVETPAAYEDFIEKASNLGDTEFMMDFHFDNYLVFSEAKAKTIVSDEYNKKSYIIVQDKSSEAAVKLLSVKEDSVVADLCAAIGMKTSSIASVLKNSGSIYACDSVLPRLKIMKDLLKKHGVENTCCICCDSSRKIKEFKVESVDYVLLDSPCSGSGMIRRPGQLYHEESSARIQKLHNLQCKMLRRALIAYKNAKRLVYSTCSIFPEENEAVVDDVLSLAEMNGWSLKDAHKTFPGFSKGSSKYNSGEKCIYFNTKRDLTNGFFVAVFQRIAPAPTEVDPSSIPNVVIRNSGKRPRDQPEGSTDRKDSKRSKKDRRKKGFFDDTMNGNKEEEGQNDKNETADALANISEGKGVPIESKNDKKKKLAPPTGQDDDTDLDNEPEEANKSELNISESIGNSQSKRKKSKKNKFVQQTDTLALEDVDTNDPEEQDDKHVEVAGNAESNASTKKKKKKKTKKKQSVLPSKDLPVQEDDVSTEGAIDSLNTSKKKSKKRKSMLSGDLGQDVAGSDKVEVEPSNESSGKKFKKRK